MHCPRTWLLVPLLVAGTVGCRPEGLVDVNAPPPVAAPPKPLRRVINLANALEAPSEGQWGVTLRSEYFDVIAQAGFDGVRMPIRWSAHAANTPPFAIETRFFERVDWSLAQARRRALSVIIDMHNYPELAGGSPGHRDRFVALWRQIAERYKGEPASVYFELLNEPGDKFTAASWNDCAREALAAIRRYDPGRRVIVGGVDWNSIASLEQLAVPADDPNVVLTFHYYAPFQFTHQGAEWVAGSGAWVGTTWAGTDAEKAAIRKDFDAAIARARALHRPVFMGEFGAYRRADLESRVRWTAFVAREAERRGIPWAYWEFAAGFGLYDTETRRWHMPLLGALMPETSR